MLSVLLVSILAADSTPPSQAPARAKVEIEGKADPKPAKPKSPPPEEAEPEDLTSVRRVYVDKFGGGATSDLLREMVISSLQNSRLFKVTEKEENADAVLKGSAEADTFRDIHISSETTNLHNGGSRTNSRSVSGPFSTHDTESAANNSGTSESSSSHTEERQHEASAAVRLVLKNGDVVWSTTQESLGAKFRGASADVADKITRQLVLDWQKAKRAKVEEP
ncbi:MAG TPA: hypothetical protein VGL53_30510 [Bryobacteraceae bacterium]|jgi:hypothetical protein